MNVSDFNFFLPADRIAAYPSPQRDASALLVLPRAGADDVTISTFNKIGDYLPPRSLLVVNETRVFPAGRRGWKATGAQVELLLTARVATAADGAPADESEEWEALSRGLG